MAVRERVSLRRAEHDGSSTGSTEAYIHPGHCGVLADLVDARGPAAVVGVASTVLAERSRRGDWVLYPAHLGGDTGLSRGEAAARGPEAAARRPFQRLHDRCGACCALCARLHGEHDFRGLCAFIR